MKKFFYYTLIDNLEEIANPSRIVSEPFEDKPIVINCLNPHSFVVALSDEVFRKALETSDFLLPDGEGIRMAMSIYGGQTIKKIAGDDLHHWILNKIDNTASKVFYLGSSDEVLGRIKQRVEKEHQGIEVYTHSPSFCDELSDKESNEIIETINNSAPDVLFVSMTAPKQEKWVYKHLDRLTNVKIIANIGAAFNFYAKTERRAYRWVIAMRLEWLWRLIKRPKKIWRRIFISTPMFFNWVRKHKSEL